MQQTAGGREEKELKLLPEARFLSTCETGREGEREEGGVERGREKRAEKRASYDLRRLWLWLGLPALLLQLGHTLQPRCLCRLLRHPGSGAAGSQEHHPSTLRLCLRPAGAAATPWIEWTDPWETQLLCTL